MIKTMCGKHCVKGTKEKEEKKDYLNCMNIFFIVTEHEKDLYMRLDGCDLRRGQCNNVWTKHQEMLFS